ncbi:MAG TPA: Gfo/Idh/MocA family oxidoreductase [Gemmatimonadaceae bacterium]|nr:Gfo/Idh/MocA family oxidoreductase [Gemmatimonadaceae bacterium]
MSDGTRLRAAIVGAGLMGKWHADAVRKVGGVVAIVADKDPSRAYGFARELGVGAASTGSVGAALSGDLVDVVHICTPPSDHPAIVRSALVAGLHVICEKPLAETAATTAELHAEATERELLLCPVHQYLFQEGVMRLTRRLPQLGRLTSAAAFMSSAGSDGGDDAARDRLAMDVLPHPLSLVGRLIPGSLANTSWNVTRAQSGEMQAVGTHQGASLSIQISTHSRPPVNALRLTGERGTANLDLFHGFVSFDDVGASRFGKIIHPFAASGQTLAAASSNLLRRASRREQAFPGLRELIRRFYAAVGAKEASPIGSTESTDVAAARDAIVAAFRREGAVG